MASPRARSLRAALDVEGVKRAELFLFADGFLAVASVC